MPYGYNLGLCIKCGIQFICGDCIKFKCPDCEYKEMLIIQGKEIPKELQYEDRTGQLRR